MVPKFPKNFSEALLLSAQERIIDWARAAARGGFSLDRYPSAGYSSTCTRGSLEDLYLWDAILDEIPP